MQNGTRHRLVSAILGRSSESIRTMTGIDTTATSDPALLAAVRQALAMPANAPVMSTDWALLTSLTADSNQVISLKGLQYAVNLQSLTLVPSDFSQPGHLTRPVAAVRADEADEPHPPGLRNH